MSFVIFKQNMLSYMSNQRGIQSYQDFAKTFTLEYDNAIRRGFQIVNKVSVLKTNTELMENILNLSQLIALQKQDGLYDIINQFGSAIEGYWIGTTLNNYPVPIIPATPAFQNIQTTSATVTKPGEFPDMQLQYPTDNSEIFLDMLVLAMKIHLFTIEGVYNTISLYPGFPTVPPAPGVLQWIGYEVPDTPPSAPNPIESIDSVGNPEQPATELSPEQVQSFTEERDEALVVASDESLPIEGRTSANEYVKLKTKELESNTINAETTQIQDDVLAELVPDESCEVGKLVVQKAMADLGILETGTPPGKNYGGFPGGIQLDQAGRIDEMFNNVGLDNQAKVQSTGTGYYWCAAAVATWWKEAGLPIPSGGASCDNWMNWGKQNGYWSDTPKIGAAVLYGKPTDADHIGIVAGITPAGNIITIEGNTSGGSFTGNGCGVFKKIPKNYLGFVIPPNCI